MNLYEINQELLACEKISETEAVNTETGEIIDIEALEKLKIDRADKLTNIIHWIKNLEADSEALKVEEARLHSRRKACDNKIESLKNYILRVVAEGEKFESDDKTAIIGWRKSESVKVDVSIWDLPEDFLKYSDPSADLVGLKKALKDGQKIEGVSLVTKQNMQIK